MNLRETTLPSCSARLKRDFAPALARTISAMLNSRHGRGRNLMSLLRW